MRKIYAKLGRLALAVSMLALSAPWVHSQTLLSTESFETDGEGTRYTSNTFMDCASEQDVFIRTNMNPLGSPTCGLTVFSSTLTGLSGSFMWVFEDIRGSTGACINCRPPGDITSSLINITSYGTLQIRVNVACSNNNGTRWENADSINIQTSINGAAFRTVGRFMGKNAAPLVGDHLGIDGNLNGVYNAGVDPAADVDVTAFTTYTFNIAGTGANLRWKIDCDEVGGSEEFAIDNIQIFGTIIVPVKWASFTGHQLDQSVKLDWATTEEVNVRNFEIERLAGDGNYMTIGTVTANGMPSSYKFVDANPNAGTNVYRIRQVDADNAFTYSDAVEVNFTQTFKTVLYPNPMHDGARLAIEGEPVSGVLNVIDNLGRNHRVIPFENVNEIEIPRDGLGSGIYYLRMDLNTGRSFTKKLMVQE